MIIEKKLDLPNNVPWSITKTEGEDGRPIEYWAGFCDLKYWLCADKPALGGTVVLRRVEQRISRPLFRKPRLGPHTVWEYSAYVPVIRGQCEDSVENALINAGLKDFILLNKQMLKQVLLHARASVSGNFRKFEHLLNNQIGVVEDSEVA